jgi:thymidylate synthase
MVVLWTTVTRRKAMQTVKDIRKQFIDLYNNQEVVEHSGGDDMLEIIGAHFEADEETIFADVNHEYVEAEIEWYSNQSTNINDIYKDVRKPPKAWTLAADHYGNINSNYGYLIFSDKYLNQYNKVVSELMRNPRSRRATMVYTRPSIWHEYDEGGKSDFICTNAVTYYWRGDELHCVVQMRSNDVVYGYRNDRAWQAYVLNKLCNELLLQPGKIIWQVQNLHIYPRHFKHVK